ncbi:MAG: cation diffusion facilitator family transporter [Phycisphaerae bacterium]
MTSDAAEHYARGQRISVLGLLVNAALAGVKLIAGLIGHSYALVADAVESMADVIASVVVWTGMRVAALPADPAHPYGYGKAEALAALVVTLLLFAAGVGIAIEAVREILTPHHAPAAFTLWVLLGVVAVKELLFRVVRRTAQALASNAVLVDAWHHRSDAITSAAAAVGIAVSLVGGVGYEPADDWAALFASGVILFNALRLCRAPLRELMDAEAGEVNERVRAVARRIAGVAGVEKVLTRKSGLRYWVDMHLEVAPEMSVRAAHGVAHDVKDAVRAALPDVVDVLIHIEPFNEPAARRHPGLPSSSTPRAPSDNA